MSYYIKYQDPCSYQHTEVMRYTSYPSVCPDAEQQADRSAARWRQTH